MTERSIAFVHRLAAQDIPQQVRERAAWLLLDLIGVACAGAGTGLSRIARDHAANHFP
ncbi:MAG: MmgE/PrpD family protein, partial [Ramlibacter sp.]|nr:MmgE/PrpD family protein [Ramlibacter sp.]